MPDHDAMLRALQEGDPAAFAELFESFADRLYRLALRLLQDEALAEDVVQETFLSALSHLDRFEGRSKLGTWLYRVAYNASMDRLRRRPEARLPADDPDPERGDAPLPSVLIDWALSPDEILGDAEARAELDAAVNSIPDSLRTVFFLRDVEELSTAETAEVVGISPGAVKVRLHRARLMLREHLAEYFAERTAAKGELP